MDTDICYYNKRVVFFCAYGAVYVLRLSFVKREVSVSQFANIDF
jgi:trimethylamine:corrinoid methyltransferase-like protein